jgi:hypothetical protein
MARVPVLTRATLPPGDSGNGVFLTLWGFYCIVGLLGFSVLVNMPAEISPTFSLFIGELIKICRQAHTAISALYNSYNRGNLFSLPYRSLRNARKALKIAWDFL